LEFSMNESSPETKDLEAVPQRALVIRLDIPSPTSGDVVATEQHLRETTDPQSPLNVADTTDFKETQEAADSDLPVTTSDGDVESDHESQSLDWQKELEEAKVEAQRFASIYEEIEKSRDDKSRPLLEHAYVILAAQTRDPDFYATFLEKTEAVSKTGRPIENDARAVLNGIFSKADRRRLSGYLSDLSKLLEGARYCHVPLGGVSRWLRNPEVIGSAKKKLTGWDKGLAAYDLYHPKKPRKPKTKPDADNKTIEPVVVATEAVANAEPSRPIAILPKSAATQDLVGDRFYFVGDKVPDGSIILNLLPADDEAVTTELLKYLGKGDDPGTASD
jgi:hypothetical protein